MTYLEYLDAQIQFAKAMQLYGERNSYSELTRSDANANPGEGTRTR